MAPLKSRAASRLGAQLSKKTTSTAICGLRRTPLSSILVPQSIRIIRTQADPPKRSSHTSAHLSDPSSATFAHPPSSTSSSANTRQPSERVEQQVLSPVATPLALLPLSSVLRTYVITTVSASPILLSLTSSLLQRMLHAKSALFNVDRNPILRWILKKTFYAQFCAGENKAEVRKFIKDVEAVGYNGVTLEYAMEVLEGEEGKGVDELAAIKAWTEGVMETIDMSKEGSFLAFKYSGMGPAAFNLLVADKPPSPDMAKALKDICDAAAAKNVRLLPAAEPQNAQKAVDAWSLDLAREYNSHKRPGPALIYNTYQCYLKSAPATIASHIATAEKEGFTLGAKLVRGAYMETEPRQLIHDTKEDTDRCYDGIAEGLMRREYNNVLQSAEGGAKDMTMPRVDIFLATHNLQSVEIAMRVKEEMHQKSDAEKADLGEVSYAQLLGMADEVSCALLAAQQKPTNISSGEPRVFKYCTWGTLGQCLNYLLRRAAENRDAMGRTKETARAMRDELLRRARKTMRLN